MQNKYDIIIIGSGLGGLECGVMLSKEGYNVCIVEQSMLCGGCLQSFKREGHNIDTGVHYVGSMGEGQILRQYFKYFGIFDSLLISPMDSDFEIVKLGDKGYYKYCNGYDNFYHSLAKEFPQQKEGLKKYCDKIYEIGSSINSANTTTHLGESAYKFINECVSDPVLQNLLAATNILYGGIKESSTLYHHAMIAHSNIEGAYRFSGGSQHIADAFVAKIKEYGGTIMNKSKVVAIETQGDIVKAIRLQNGESLFADTFISNLHPLTTFNLVTDTAAIKKAYRTRLSLLPNTYALFSVYLIMKENKSIYDNKNYYFYDKCNSWDTVMESSSPNPKMTFLSFQRTSPNALYNDVATIMTPMHISGFQKWIGTNIEKRGEDYTELKATITQNIIEYTCKHYPKLQNTFSQSYSASPLTYLDYLGTPQGSAYGILKDYKSPMTTLFSARTKLKNLLLTGQNLNIHGVLGVTLSAVITCSELLGKEYLAKQIASGK